MGLASFLGVQKFGQGLASAGRALTGGVNRDIQSQNQTSSDVQKLLYAARREKDPQKQTRLLKLAQSFGTGTNATDIDQGLNLSNKEVLGSAANVALNVAAPGAFKGGKTSVIAKNALVGAGFGAASAANDNKKLGGTIGSTLLGAGAGAALGAGGLLAKAAKDFVGTKLPTWMMNKAVKPALQDLKKNVKFGSPTLGEDLLTEGVKGGPRRLLEIAEKNLTSLEDDLQRVLSDPTLAKAQIRRDTVFPHLREMMLQKHTVPGGRNDMIQIKDIYNDLPEVMSLPQAQAIKRSIYQELRSPAYRLDANLTTKTATLKNIAKGLKTEIENTVGGTVVQDINRKLSIYGRLENSMVDQLARELRNNGIGLTDAVLAAGGWPTTILGLLRHVGKGTETHIAQGLNKFSKLGTGPVGKGVKELTRKATLNLP